MAVAVARVRIATGKFPARAGHRGTARVPITRGMSRSTSFDCTCDVGHMVQSVTDPSPEECSSSLMQRQFSQMDGFSLSSDQGLYLPQAFYRGELGAVNELRSPRRPRL
jgi:hypothetical protein